MQKQEDMAARSQPSGAPESAATDAQPSGAFTPGPWVVTATSGNSYGGDCSAWEIETRGDEGHWVVAAVITDVEAVRDAGEANARLIAAAPELLKALKELCGNAEVARAHIHGVPELSSALFDTIGQARDAIAKAEGSA